MGGHSVYYHIIKDGDRGGLPAAWQSSDGIGTFWSVARLATKLIARILITN